MSWIDYLILLVFSTSLDFILVSSVVAATLGFMYLTLKNAPDL